MLVFTNRDVGAQALGTAFEQGSDRLSLAEVDGSAQGGWVLVHKAVGVSDDEALQRLVALFQAAAGKPVLVYVHGNNNTPAACFERCQALRDLYQLEVIGFSWPSEGYAANGARAAHVMDTELDGDENELAAATTDNRQQGWIRSKINRYHQATLNGRHSGEALARFLRLLATARLYANTRPFTLAAHSLGAQFLEYALDLPGASESTGAAQNIVLLAPCVRANGHAGWLGKMRPKGQLFVTYNQGDSVLAAASIADNFAAPKLGIDPGAERLRMPYMRYINCIHAAKGIGGHSYFKEPNMSKAMKRVFGRIFASEPDLYPGEIDRKVYGIKGDEDGLTKYFNAPSVNAP